MPNGACLPCDVVIVSINGGRLSKALKSVRKAPKRNPTKSNRSAGILVYRKGRQGLEVLLVHPGGPFWRNKDQGAWSIPKGEIGSDEDPEKAALREFTEELGPSASVGPLRALGEVRQRGGKLVIAFSGEGSFDPEALVSNTFEMEWPPRSGRHQSFPEVDRAGWFPYDEAQRKLLKVQLPVLEALRSRLAAGA